MTQNPSYTSTAKLLHWGMALIWISAWFIGIFATHWRDEFNAHHELTFLHKAIASTLLMLIFVRVLWRVAYPAPPLPDTMSTAAKRIAHLGHVAIYVVALVALPLSGWYWSSVADKPIMVAGMFNLPPLVDPAQHLYDLAKAIHTYTSWVCGALIAGHILIAIKHHLIDRDGILERMLPSKN